MKTFNIAGRKVGGNEPAFLIAEMSANHCGSLERAKEIIHAAKASGADAIKLQTYTPDSLTIDSHQPCFTIQQGLWKGESLYQLYAKAHMPWEWHDTLFAEAESLGLVCFSTPFDIKGIELLKSLNCPVYKIASFEAVDYELIGSIAETGKPVIMSSGMCNKTEIEQAIGVLRERGCKEIALLKCISAYPAPLEGMNLKTLTDFENSFGVVPGLSDHTLGSAIAIAAISIGAKIIEKHFILDKSHDSPDAAFSMTPDEFKSMTDGIRQAEQALGQIEYGPNTSEKDSLMFRRSIFVIEDIPAGETLTPDNIRVIRPGHGLHPAKLSDIIGKKARQYLEKGQPLTLEDITP